MQSMCFGIRKSKDIKIANATVLAITRSLDSRRYLLRMVSKG